MNLSIHLKGDYKVFQLTENKGAFAFIVLSLMLTLASCSKNPAVNEASPPSSTASLSAAAPISGASQANISGQIYLYGELHGIEKILEKETELWYEHYHNDNMRHLFVELPYYTAEYLNLWMQSDNDEILDTLYNDWEGSAAHNPYIKAFYQKIKQDCPQTVFHGTDVGHQYAATGERFLNWLRENGLEDSEQYRCTQTAIEQGKYYYDQSADAYRENKMSENFIYEFEKLNGESIMGIYGAAHIGLDSMDMTGTVPSMANQLKERYGDAIHSEDISWVAKATEPQGVDIIRIDGKDYTASFFGREDLTGFKDYASRAFWRLENAYDDFKENPKTGDVLPYNNYPMLIEVGQVFVVEYVKTDGSVMKSYYRSDGAEWSGMLSTEEFTIG